MKKRLLFIVSLLAVAFALAGCRSNEKTVEFEYDNDELAQYATDSVSYYLESLGMPEFYDYVMDAGDESGIAQIDRDAIAIFYQMEEDYGKFIDFTGEYELEENKDTVICSLYADCEDTGIEINVTLESNLPFYNMQLRYAGDYGYTEDEIKSLLAMQGVYPYKVSEYEVANVQTFADKMKAAGTNTIIGMGIVFIVLIFISFIISLLKYVPMIFDKETREARRAEKAKVSQVAEDKKSDDTKVAENKTEKIVDIVNTETGESVMNDSELVAVITAAVAANSASEPTVQPVIIYPSNDKLVARPIRRIKR